MGLYLEASKYKYGEMESNLDILTHFSSSNCFYSYSYS